MSMTIDEALQWVRQTERNKAMDMGWKKDDIELFFPRIELIDDTEIDESLDAINNILEKS